MRLGFACAWESDPQRTWSGTPWSLWQALGRQADVADLGPHLSPLARRAMKVLYARRRNDRFVSTWKWSRAWEGLSELLVTRSAARHRCDAVLQIQDVAHFERPFFLYQDMSIDLLVEVSGQWGGELPGFEAVSPRTIKRRQERQRRLYEQATGLFTLSHWLADDLTNRSGIPREKVRVVYPGTNNAPPAVLPSGRRMGGNRLLFLGRDFSRKGGDIAVAALRILRRDFDPSTTLTIGGPVSWPEGGEPPEGVSFVGAVGAADVARLYACHDLFVMPSRFEAFGIVFLEALSWGLPCIGRDAFAMPEMITPGVNGALVQSDDPDELARAIVQTLEDGDLRERCWAQREDVARRYSWTRAAEEILGGITQCVA